MVPDLLGQKGIAAYVEPLVVLTFDVGKMQAAKDAQLTEGSPDLAVLSTGHSSAYMNQPCEVPSARAALAWRLGLPGHPQLVLRLGLAEPVHAAPRRPVAEVLRDG